MTIPTLNLVGAGRAGRTVARLLATAHQVRIGQVRTRSLGSARDAVAFIGSGTPVEPERAPVPASWWLLATGDSALAGVAAALADTGVVRPGDLAFHLSGALGADVLGPLAAAGASTVSVHPVHSFADPVGSVATFAGSSCVLDGDASGVATLTAAMRAIGAETLEVRSADKLLYHAGTVVASNKLVALIETALGLFESAGIDRDLACRLVGPLMRGTLNNALSGSPCAALTGPVARGDSALVARQVEAVAARAGDDVARIYVALGAVELDLVRRRGTLSRDEVAALDAIFRGWQRSKMGL